MPGIRRASLLKPDSIRAPLFAQMNPAAAALRPAATMRYQILLGCQTDHLSGFGTTAEGFALLLRNHRETSARCMVAELHRELLSGNATAMWLQGRWHAQHLVIATILRLAARPTRI